FVEPVEKGVQPVPYAGFGQRFAVGLCRQSKAVRDTDAEWGQVGIKLAQGRGLAADHGNVAQANVAEPADVALARHDLLLLVNQSKVGLPASALIFLNRLPSKIAWERRGHSPGRRRGRRWTVGYGGSPAAALRSRSRGGG